MEQVITSFVGLDVHKDSIAIAVADTGREAPRFVGTTVAVSAKLLKVLAPVSACIRQPSKTLSVRVITCIYISTEFST